MNPVASVCSIWTCAVIGALGAWCPGALADVIVSCEIGLDPETRDLVGVDERVFDPAIHYSSPNQIRSVALFLIDGRGPERFLSGYVVDEDLAQVPANTEALDIDVLELEWDDLVVETDGTMTDVPALIHWTDQEQTQRPVFNHLERAPTGSILFQVPTTTLGIGFTG
jgi:hypothetical protein